MRLYKLVFNSNHDLYKTKYTSTKSFQKAEIMLQKTTKNATIVDKGATNGNWSLRYLFLQIEGKMDILPGQFVALEPLNGGSFIVPFSVTNLYSVGNNTRVHIHYKIVGKKSSSTNFYAKLNIGDKIKVVGPCGRGFKIPGEIKHAIFVAGGTGTAGLQRILADFLNSGKTAECLIGANSKKEVIKFFAEDWQGVRVSQKTIFKDGGGLVTDLLIEALKEKRPNSAVIACGPRGMLKAVYDLARENDTPCFVSIEELMACGTGSCKGCAIEMVDQTILNVCKDGPVFDAYKINWEKFLPPETITFPKSYLTDPFATTIRGQNGRKLELPYPWMIASGCLGIDEAEKMPLERIGAYVTKGVKLHPTIGNPAPRICETSHGMINSIGLPNIGIERFIKEELPRWLNLGKKVIINVAGESIKDYQKIMEKLQPFPIAAYEINISCPNVDKGGMAFGTDPKTTFETIQGVREANPDGFIIVKLTPNVTDIAAIALAASNGGADALTVSNTLEGMDINVETSLAKIGKITGGYSGPAILPIILAKVHKIIKKDVGIPIIGCGGINDGECFLKYILAGAAGGMIGTSWFTNKNIFNEIADYVSDYLNRHNTDHVECLVGKMPF